jgi:hypothetical protein
MTRNVSRRIERPEERTAVAIRTRPFSARVFLVDPETGLTGVLRLEADKSTTSGPTPAEQEWFRTHTLSKRHRATSETATDIR